MLELQVSVMGQTGSGGPYIGYVNPVRLSVALTLDLPRCGYLVVMALHTYPSSWLSPLLIGLLKYYWLQLVLLVTVVMYCGYSVCVHTFYRFRCPI